MASDAKEKFDLRMCIYGGINKFELEIDNQEVLMQNVHCILWFNSVYFVTEELFGKGITNCKLYCLEAVLFVARILLLSLITHPLQDRQRVHIIEAVHSTYQDYQWAKTTN